DRPADYEVPDRDEQLAPRNQRDSFEGRGVRRREGEIAYENPRHRPTRLAAVPDRAGPTVGERDAQYAVRDHVVPGAGGDRAGGEQQRDERKHVSDYEPSLPRSPQKRRGRLAAALGS